MKTHDMGRAPKATRKDRAEDGGQSTNTARSPALPGLVYLNVRLLRLVKEPAGTETDREAAVITGFVGVVS